MDDLEKLRKLAELELKRRRASSSLVSYEAFQQRYFDDPVGFVRDCIDFGGDNGGPTDYQADIMQSLVDSRRVCVRGPHGLGKTAMLSWIVLWFALTRDGRVDWKCPTTASNWRQLSKFLWPEIHKWARRLRWDRIGREKFDTNKELLTLSLRLRSGEAFAMATHDSNLIEGAHATQLLYIFDEAKSIPTAMWDAVEGAFSTGDCYWIAASTPSEYLGGRFYEIQVGKEGYEDWVAIHVTKEQAIAAGRMKQSWAESRKRQWGEFSAEYQTRVEGNFATSESGIPLIAIENSIKAWKEKSERNELGEPLAIGVDVGVASDKSIAVFVGYDAVIEIVEIPHQSTMDVAREVALYLRKYLSAVAVIDAAGIGAGVVDRLLEEPDIADRVIAFRAQERSPVLGYDARGFANKRSAMWWRLKEEIVAGRLAIPDHQGLKTDLTVVQWFEASDGRLLVTRKEDIRKAIGRSTDYGDALAMALWAGIGENSVVVEADVSISDYRG